MERTIAVPVSLLRQLDHTLRDLIKAMVKLGALPADALADLPPEPDWGSDESVREWMQ